MVKVALSYGKEFTGLLRGKTSPHYGDFHCLNCFRSYRAKSKLELPKKYVKTVIIAT